MKVFKIMSIIGMCLAGISFICLIAFYNPKDYEAAIGWGMYAAMYLLAFSIVVFVKNKNINN